MSLLMPRTLYVCASWPCIAYCLMCCPVYDGAAMAHLAELRDMAEAGVKAEKQSLRDSAAEAKAAAKAAKQQEKDVHRLLTRDKRNNEKTVRVQPSGARVPQKGIQQMQ